MNPAREEILAKVKSALKSAERSPDWAQVPARAAGDLNSEIELLFAEIRRLSGHTCRIKSRDELKIALEELIRAESIQKATLWKNTELEELGIAEMLRTWEIQMIPPLADQRQLAECDLGITSADAALPETGTLLLRTLPEQPQLVSLLPRVHLAIFRPAVLCADLHQAFELARNDQHSVLISGASRTADIEKVLTIGVHGPKVLYVWSYED